MYRISFPRDDICVTIRPSRLGINQRGRNHRHSDRREMSSREHLRLTISSLKPHLHALLLYIAALASHNSAYFFLQNPDSLCTERHFDSDIIWCYRERTAVPSRHFAVLRKNIRFNEGVPKKFDNAQSRPFLEIFDDLLNDVYSKQVCDLFTKGIHHIHISVILISQNLFHQGRYCRDISLKAKYLVLLEASGIRIISCTWIVKFIPKIVTVYTKRT